MIQMRIHRHQSANGNTLVTQMLLDGELDINDRGGWDGNTL